MIKKGINKAKVNLGISFLLVVVGVIIVSRYSREKHLVDEKKQNMMTPHQVLQDLINGNKRFYSNKAAKRRSLVRLSQKASERGQFPKAVILACMDSRSIPEMVFDQSIADIFTLRVAGNVVSGEMIASMEYATKHMGSKLIVIMGHTQCGAIKTACSTYKGSGYLEALINDIAPAVAAVKKESPDKKLDCVNNATINRIAKYNVRFMIDRVIRKSTVIRELLSEGKIGIVGALHNLETGVVTFEQLQRADL